MEPLIDTLLYLIILGSAALVIGALLCGIHKMLTRIHRANARLIWKTVERHRRRAR